MTKSEIIEIVLAAPPERYTEVAKAARGVAPARKPQPINIKEVATILGVCIGTARRMQQRGLITPRRFSKRLLRYEKTEILALLETPAAVKEMEV